MTKRNSFFAAIVAALTSASGCPALAADGEILITQAKALAGNITPGDTPGYPVTLSQPGSYRLGGNLTPDAGKTGIHITGAFVTLEMSGFALLGSNKANTGIYGTAPGARIQNGSIASFKNYGLYDNAGTMWTVENVLVTGNGSAGIVLGSRMARVFHSIIANNLGDGLICNLACLVEGNIVTQNGAYGLEVSTGATRGNVILDNASYGLVGAYRLGFGENTIENNNKGGNQTLGSFKRLFPNACAPTPCP